MLRSLTCVAVVVVCSNLSAQDGFQQLFNGKDLSGWSGDPALWSVEDGCITGETNGPDHLEYNKFLIWNGTAADFEFRCEFRLEGENNSGVQYRSVHDKARGEFVCVGYQADIHGKAEFTGMLYDEKGRGIIARRGDKVVVGVDGKKKVSKLDGDIVAVDLSEWHELTIVAKGNHLVHKLDGVVTVDITDNQKEEAETEGVIAFQVHRGKAMKAQFRNIRLKKFENVAAAGKEKQGPTAATKRMKKKTASKAPVAQWIWVKEGDKPADHVYFRKEIDSGGVAAARLYAACDDSMKIFVDGKEVISSSSWERPVYVDLSKHLDLDDPEKKHVIAVEAENGKSAAGFLVKLDLESGWRDAWSIVSNSSWQAATKVQKGWKTRNFQADSSWRKPDELAALGAGPWGKKINADTLAAAAPLKEPTATPVADLKIAKGFAVELLYTVPKDEQGSWVNMCTDPQGRLIVSDQYGALYRVTPPGILNKKELTVEQIKVDIGEAQGLLWAFDSLYVSVNKGQKYAGGLYRVRDTDGDDQLDTVETLRALNGSGEHGPHAVLRHPDGKNLVIVCGNRTDLTEIVGSMVPSWDEDVLLPRALGKFMKGTRAPGGCIYKIDPDGKEWTVIASGFRNQFDAAYNNEGELFTYDADMEWDINTPWYRPTRICHVVSGAEFGWRSGGGKWPAYYPDSVPPVVNVGPGSPTGVCFGYGAHFPEKYRNALYACDWSYGKLYACHMQPNGATFTGRLEEFITGTPLPLTDVITNPHDGAMYFTIGGRKVQSGLYRVTSLTPEKNDAASGAAPLATGHEARRARRLIEEDHSNPLLASAQFDVAWNYLGSSDQSLRYAARVTVEKQPREKWQGKALSEQDPQAKLTALLALARSFERTEKGESPNIDTPIPNWKTFEGDAERTNVTSAILSSIAELDIDALSNQQRLELLRVISVTFLRVCPPNARERDAIINVLRNALPSENQMLNSEISQLMVYLQAPYAAKQIVPLLEAAPTQEEQIDYARTLRHLKSGWTPALQNSYFSWFTRAATYQGGSSFQLFVNNIKADAVAQLSEEDKARLQPILDAKPELNAPAFTAVPRKFVKEWTMEELVPLLETELKNRNFEHGRQMFGAASCFACHRFDNQGGSVGPDLTSLSGRFSARDLLESVLDPSKQISDQYGSVQIITVDGKVINGRIINLAGDSFRVQTDMLRPGNLTGVDRKQIEEMFDSKVSMMPKGLLNTLQKEEVLDLMAYLLSRGDRTHAMFAR